MTLRAHMPFLTVPAIIALMLVAVPAAGQTLRFEQIGSEQGLPQRTVLCVMQDGRGFIWIGTQEGLCRYDGGRFRVYRRSSTRLPTISNDAIRCFCEDRDGMLWVGTRQGLNRFDPGRGEWTRFYAGSPENGDLGNDAIHSLAVDSRDRLWVGTDNGVYRRGQDGRFTRIALAGVSAGGELRVLSLRGDGQENMWIGTEGQGLFVYDGKEKEAFRFAGGRELPGDEVHALAFDDKQRLWVGTQSGAAVLRPGDAKLLRISHASPGVRVSAFAPDGAGGMWLGLYGGGVEHWYNPNLLRTVYRHREDRPHSLSNDRVTSLLQDASGNIWVGTFDGGLNRCNLLNSQFHHLRDIGGPRPSASDRMAWSITVDSSNGIWIGTENGIHVLPAEGTGWQHIAPGNSGAAGISHPLVWSLMADSRGRVWAGTRNGLNCYTRKGTSIQRIPLPLNALSHALIYALMEARDGTIWVGCASGLYAYQPESGTLRCHLDSVPQAQGKEAVQPWCMVETDDGRIWVGSNGLGLFYLYPGDETPGRVEQSPGGLASSTITSMCAGEDDVLWLGTLGGGLHRFDTRDLYVTNITESEGLANNTIYGILRDDHGRIWTSTNHGISMYDPASRRIMNFGVRDGLQAEEFNLGATAQFRDGRMCFGGSNGINVFDPSLIRYNAVPPPVVITAVRARAPGLTSSDVVWSGTAPALIELPASSNFLAVEFAALEYSDPSANRFSWKIEGLSDAWLDTTRQRTARLPGLAPGEYVFRVRACNNHGVWSEQAAAITLRILPPWWQSWWFRLLVLLLLLTAVAGAVYYRRQQGRQRTHLLEECVHQREKELESVATQLRQKNDDIDELHDALRSTQAKLTYANKMASLGQMTAGIAHEIKNPINFVNNFAFSSVDIARELLEILEQPGLDQAALAERVAPLIEELVTTAEKISEHGARVDRIVQSMLLHSHGQAGIAEAVDLNEFLEQYVALAYHGMRAQVQNFNVTIEREYSELVTQVPLIRQDVARVFVNLLNNAFQAVFELQERGEVDYEPTVRVESGIEGNMAFVRIEDNGRGVPEHLRARIFEPFFTTKSAGSGTGLGLSLSREIIVDGHGGDLRYEPSRLGGACFVLLLPLG